MNDRQGMDDPKKKRKDKRKNKILNDNQRNGFITCSKEKEIINWDEDRPQRRDTSSFLVWITLGFSWVLPLVLGLDAWLFSLHLQSCEAIILQRSREVSANYLKSWDCEAVGLLLRKIQVIHRQIIWKMRDRRNECPKERWMTHRE